MRISVPVIPFVLVLVCLYVIGCLMYQRMYWGNSIENMSQQEITPSKEYLASLKPKGMFPFRYFHDENSNPLPIVAVTGFFRDKDAEDRYAEYLQHGIKIIGVTAYKSFPKPIKDGADDYYHLDHPFDYTRYIQNWLCCFRDPTEYGFSDYNNLVDISESDIYDSEPPSDVKKEYDFIYICNKDGDTCPMDGWNAVNRNYKLFVECLPIMINEYKLKGLLVGRVGCGLEEKYGDSVEVTDWLDWYTLQDKMRASRFLFVPNIYDASPRVVAECLTKGLPVLMNHTILCGSKYINEHTGELFIDQYDIRGALDKLVPRIDKMDTKSWWTKNYGTDRTSERIRDFLNPFYPHILKDVKRVRFLL